MKLNKINQYFSFLVIPFLFTACQSPAEKREAGIEMNNQTIVEESKIDSVEAAIVDEWKVFQMETKEKIQKNETDLEELKRKIRQKGRKADKQMEERIDSLEQRNKRLKSKLDNYNQTESDWNSFKEEFRLDMDELGKALSDFTSDRKK